MLRLKTDTKRCQKSTRFIFACWKKDRLLDVASMPQWRRKILQPETNSKFRSLCNTFTRQNPTFTNKKSSIDHQLRTVNSWDWPCTGRGKVCCSHDWSSPGPLQKRQKSVSPHQQHLCCLFTMEMVSCWICTLRVHLQTLVVARISYFSKVFISHCGPIFPPPRTLHGKNLTHDLIQTLLH